MLVGDSAPRFLFFCLRVCFNIEDGGPRGISRHRCAIPRVATFAFTPGILYPNRLQRNLFIGNFHASGHSRKRSGDAYMNIDASASAVCLGEGERKGMGENEEGTGKGEGYGEE